MSPDVTDVLRLLAERVRDDAVPALNDSYAGQQLQRSVGMLQSAAAEFERAAAWRWQEWLALRALFGQAAAVLPAGSLATAVAAAAAVPVAPEADALRISALDAVLARQRALLIELHVWCELHPGPAAARIEEGIWAELRAGTERRRVANARF